MISKSFTRVAGFVVAAVASALFLLGCAGAAAATTESTTPTDGATANRGNAAPTSNDETHALVVGGVAFVLMIGTAGAVLWNTTRKRHTPH